MGERFVFADPHYSHKGVIKFAGKDGKPLRPWGRVPTEDDPMSEEEAVRRVTEMDEEMVSRWNAKVSPRDKVEVLGDVVMSARALPILDRLNGKKRLRSGNHDLCKVSQYMKYFEEVSAYKIIDDILMCHMPVHEDVLTERWRYNVHGHLHDRCVMYSSAINLPSIAERSDLPHPNYICVSAEQVDYAPIPMEEVLVRIKAQELPLGTIA